MTREGVTSVVAALSTLCFGCARLPANFDTPPNSIIELAVEDGKGGPVVLNSGLLVLDELEQGGRISKTLFARNVSRSAIGIKDVTCSCECVTLTSLPAEITPGGAERVQLNINLEDEPSFTGEMQVVVSLFLRDTSAADFESIPLRIRFRVVPRHPADTTE